MPRQLAVDFNHAIGRRLDRNQACGDPRAFGWHLQPNRSGDSRMVALVAEYDDALGLEVLPGVTDTLGPVVLLSDRKDDFSSHDPTVDSRNSSLTRRCPLSSGSRMAERVVSSR